MVVESEQIVKDPTTGIETAPSNKEKPRILHTHDQHTADYVRIMMEEGMDLSMGEDRAPPWITELYALISLSSAFQHSTTNSPVTMIFFLLYIAFHHFP